MGAPHGRKQPPGTQRARGLARTEHISGVGDPDEAITDKEPNLNICPHLCGKRSAFALAGTTNPSSVAPPDPFRVCLTLIAQTRTVGRVTSAPP
jgi:hypothetical protein